MSPTAEAVHNTEDTEDTKAVRLARMVREMRAHWRAAGEDIDGPRSGQRHKDQGDQLFVALTRELQNPLARLAGAYFHDDNSLIEDGVREQITALYESLRDLSDSPRAKGWENPRAFWTCLKRQASNLFLRRVQHDYARNYAEGQEVSSYTTGMAELPDADAEAALRGLLESDALGQLLAAIPDKRHRDALILTVQGMPRDKIARRLGCSIKSVYNYEQKGREAALAWAVKRYQSEGAYADWLTTLPLRNSTAE